MPQNGTAAETQHEQDTTGPLLAAITDLTDTVRGLREDLAETPATRAIEQSSPPAQQPSIQVGSEWDNVTLWGMLFRDEFQRLDAARKGRLHQREEAFMRACVDKARKLRDAQTDLPVGHLRAVDEPAFRAWHERVPHLRADEAMQSTLAGSGDELVPQLLNSVAHYEFRLQSRVWGLLRSIMMPSQPFDYPTISGGPTFRRALEPTDRSHLDLGSSHLKDDKPTTSSIQFSAGKLGILALVSKDLLEDSGIGVADMLAQQFARNAARDIDYVLLNGDERTAATNISHSADPTGSAYDRVLILDGLRRIAQAASDNTSVTTIATTSGLAVQALMGDRGIIGLDVANLVHVVDPGFMYKLLALTDFQTLDKVGDRATYLTGQIGSWYGAPVVVSDELEYTDASGLYPADHSSGTKGQMVTLHRDLLVVGYRRMLETAMSMPPHTDMLAMSATIRLDLKALETGAVGWGYNATV